MYGNGPCQHAYTAESSVLISPSHERYERRAASEKRALPSLAAPRTTTPWLVLAPRTSRTRVAVQPFMHALATPHAGQLMLPEPASSSPVRLAPRTHTLHHHSDIVIDPHDHFAQLLTPSATRQPRSRRYPTQSLTVTAHTVCWTSAGVDGDLGVAPSAPGLRCDKGPGGLGPRGDQSGFAPLCKAADWSSWL